MLNSSGFDLWANEYDHDVALRNSENRYPFAGYQDVLSSIYKRIGENGGRKVLDIGFGTAILSKKLYDDGMEITGIDFSNEMIKTAREKMPEAIGQKSTKMFRFIYRASHKTGRIVNPGAAAHNRSVV